MEPPMLKPLDYARAAPNRRSVAAGQCFWFALASTVLLCALFGGGVVLARVATRSQFAEVRRSATMFIGIVWGVVTAAFSLYGVAHAATAWREARARGCRNLWQAVVAMLLHGLLLVGAGVVVLSAVVILGRTY